MLGYTVQKDFTDKVTRTVCLIWNHVEGGFCVISQQSQTRIDIAVAVQGRIYSNRLNIVHRHAWIGNNNLILIAVVLLLKYRKLIIKGYDFGFTALVVQYSVYIALIIFYALLLFFMRIAAAGEQQEAEQTPRGNFRMESPLEILYHKGII